MSLPINNKSIFKGQNKTMGINVSSTVGVVNIAGYTITFTVRQVIGGDAIISKTTAQASEILITDAVAGEAECYFTPVDTLSLTVGKYYYDLWITDLNNETRPILAGLFWVEEVAPSLVVDIREVLGEAGDLMINKVSDEAIKPAALNKIFATRRRIQSVEGVWLLSDTDHTGTNYYTGGGYRSESGEIWLGTPLAVTTNYVRVSYSWESGVTDGAITHHLNESKLFVQTYTGIEFSYGAAITSQTKAAEAMALARTVISCILTINGANVAQMGYNFRLDEFEIQTKLWGEGMIAEALFNLYIRTFDQWLQAIGRVGYTVAATPVAPRYSMYDQLTDSENRSSSDSNSAEGGS